MKNFFKALKIKKIIIILAILMSSYCGNGNPLTTGKEAHGLKILFFYIDTSNDSAVFTWICNSEAEGYVIYGTTIPNTLQISPFKEKIHRVTVTGLTAGTKYNYSIVCKNLKTISTPEQSFITKTSSPDIDVKLNSKSIVSGETIDLGKGKINSDNSYTFTIKNETGPSQLSISKIGILGTDSSLFQLNTSELKNTIDPVTSTSFKLIFNPTSLGSKTAKIEITSNDPDEQLFTINLKADVDPVSDAVRLRGIWIVGGIEGTQATPIVSNRIDLFDPLTQTWVSTLASPMATIPTPRTYAMVVSHKQKIYIIGGLTGFTSTNTGSPTNLVEIFDPLSTSSNPWTTGTSAPSNIYGAVADSMGDSIYIVGGSTQIPISASGFLGSTVYVYSPASLSNPWNVIINNPTTRVEMSGCGNFSLGKLFYSLGRLNTGNTNPLPTPQFISPPVGFATNTGAHLGGTTARVGAAAICYRPLSTDPYPYDTQAFLLIGGSSLPSTAVTTIHPFATITGMNQYNYMNASSVTWTVNPLATGLPNLYAPAAEIGYNPPKIFVFGGATGTAALPTPTGQVFVKSIDGANITVAGGWTALAASLDMPKVRYKHSAILIGR